MTDKEKNQATARTLGSQTLVVALGNVFTLVVGLPLQIYVSRVLGTGGLGTYGLLDAAVSTTNGFINFGLAQTVTRFVPSHLAKSEYGWVRRLLRASVIVQLLAGVLVYGLWLIALPYAERIWPELAGQGLSVAMMGLMIPLGLLLHLLQQGLRGFHEIRYMILGSSVVQLSVKAAITIAVFSVGMTLAGYVLATTIAALVGVVWMAYGLRRKVTGMPEDEIGSPDSPNAEWRRYSAISYANALLGAATAYLDRLLLGYFVGIGAVGVLVVVRQLQQFPSMFNQMLLMVGAPMFAAAHVRNDPSEREHIYVLMTDWVMKAALPLILFLLLFAKPILLLFGPQFAEGGAGVLWIFLLGQAINLACGPVGNIAVMSGLESESLRLGAFNTALYAGLLVILTPTLGLLGVAIATVTATIFLNFAIMLLLRRRLGLRWWHRRFAGWFLPSLAAAVPGAAAIFLGLAANAFQLAAILILMYAMFAAVLVIRGVNADEKELLHYLWNYIFVRRTEA